MNATPVIAVWSMMMIFAVALLLGLALFAHGRRGGTGGKLLFLLALIVMAYWFAARRSPDPLIVAAHVHETLPGETTVDQQSRLQQQVRGESAAPVTNERAYESVPAKQTSAEIDDEIPLELSQAADNSNYILSSSPVPEWVERTPPPRGDVFFRVASVGPLPTQRDCDREMSHEMQRTVNAYVDSLVGSAGAGDRLNINPLAFGPKLIADEAEQQVEHKSEVGTMQHLHRLLQFDRAAQQLIRSRYEEALVSSRLTYTAGGAAVLLALLLTVFGYLKLDTITKGYYSGRLKLAAAAVILAVAALTVALAQRVPAL